MEVEQTTKKTYIVLGNTEAEAFANLQNGEYEDELESYSSGWISNLLSAEELSSDEFSEWDDDFCLYVCQDKEIDDEEDFTPKTSLEHFSKRVGFILKPEIEKQIHLTGTSHKSITKAFSDFARSCLSQIGHVVEYHNPFEDEFQRRVNGRFQYTANLENAELFSGSSNSDVFHKIKVNGYRFSSPDEAVIRLFKRLTGLSPYIQHHVLVKDKEKDVSKHFQFDWEQNKFTEQPTIEFTQKDHDWVASCV